MKMEILNIFFRQSSIYLFSMRSYSSHSFSLSPSSTTKSSFLNKSLHCYKTLFPWENFEEFSKYLISNIFYNEGGLLVLNKPFGIKIHGHDKPGTRPKSEHQLIKLLVPQCDYTIEDSLPIIQKHFDLPNLSIVKSAERYTSGVVLLSSSDQVTQKLQKSFNWAKHQMKPHLVHWAVTVGYPVVPYRKEKVGINFVETEQNKIRQPVIHTEISKRACKLKKVYSVNVESRALSVNEKLSTSLVEITTSSVKWHFVRVYASSRVAPILGDNIYGSRMKKLFGVPVKMPLQDSVESGCEPLSDKISETLNIPKGASGQLMIPPMLHLRRVILPNYLKKGQDFCVTADLPVHFQWTVNKLNLLNECK